MSGVEFPLTDGMIDFLVAELPDAACRDLLRELLRERRANGGDAVGRAALEFLRVEVARELREIRAAVGTPVADGAGADHPRRGAGAAGRPLDCGGAVAAPDRG